MPSTDPEVNSRGIAKRGSVIWMGRRMRGDCADADTRAKRRPKPNLNLIGEMRDRQAYFERAVGDREWSGQDITRICVDANAGDAEAKEEAIMLYTNENHFPAALRWAELLRSSG